MMKTKQFFLFAFARFVAANSAFAQQVVSLDEAIKQSVALLHSGLAMNTRVAVLNFAATDRVSEYVVDELTALITNGNVLTVVDRENLQMLRDELEFQASGEVSDESAQRIGQMLGAQTIISGRLSSLGKSWRMTIKALAVETTEVQAQATYTIREDRVLLGLLPATPKTTPEKIQTGALNLVLGLGSYLEGDVFGGLTLTASYVVAAGLFVVEATMMDWDNPMVGLPATVGVTLAGLTVVYGFARPFIYNNAPRVAAVLDRTQAVVTSSENTAAQSERTAVAVSYRVTF
jgi:hypothetical protein